jgi:hypothetical protein
LDDPIVWIGIIIFGIIVVWGWLRRWSGDYDDEGGPESDESYSDYDSSHSSWGNSSRRSSMGGSLFRSSGSSSSRQASSGSSSPVIKSRPTKSFDSPKIQSRGGFGRSKK